MAHSILKYGMFRAVCMTVLYAKLVLSKSEVNLEFRRHINEYSQFGEEPPFATELVKVEDNEQHRKSNAQNAPNAPENIHPDTSKAVASNKYLGFSKPRGGFQRITDTEDKPEQYNQAYLNSLRFKLIRTKRETFESPLIVGPLPPGFRSRVNGGDESFTDQRGGLLLDQPLVSNRPVRRNFEREPTRSGLLNEPGRFQPYFSVNEQFSNQPPRQFFENTQGNYWNQPVRDPYFQPNYNDNLREEVYRPEVEQNFQGVPWNEQTTNQQVTGQGQVSEGEDVQVGGQTDVRDAGSVENQVRGVDVDLAGGEGGVSETGDANVGYDEDINNVPSRPSAPLYDYQEEEEEECVCVDYFLCDILNKTVITTGEGLLEPRLAEDEDAVPTPKRKREVKSCPGVQVCCAPPPGDTPIQTIEQRTPTVGSFETCGVQRADPNTISPLALRIQDVDEEETYLGEFPWMLAVLGAAQGRKYICGASLIHPQVALTAAHCVKNFSAGDLVVRAGEWDPRTQDEPLQYQDRAVNSIIRHPSHRPDTLYHDVALLVLQEPFVEADNVGVVCLPGPGARFNLVNCVASGWGQDKLGTQETFQTPLKKVELPIVPHDECQKKLRTTRLGPFFKLHGSFICAGGESGRDTCQDRAMWMSSLLLIGLALGCSQAHPQGSDLSTLIDQLYPPKDSNNNAKDNTNNAEEPTRLPSPVESSDNNPLKCQCVPYYLCQNNSIITDGVGLIDIRIKEGPCENYLDVCCQTPDRLTDPITPKPNIRTGCGYRNPEGIGFRITGHNDNEAQFGEFPWMVAILREEAVAGNDQKLNVYQCGGSLIHPQVVITAAHCVNGKNPSQLKIRAGEWDTQTKNELFTHQDRDVSKVIVHDKYYGGALYNDVALLVLSEPLVLGNNVEVVCLPKQGEVLDRSRCFASGWGKDVFGKEGRYQVILKKVELPIVPRNQCEDALRKTRLGPYFKLHESFICAGGEMGRDTCKGDGGSPLVCPIANNPNQYIQAGIVAWGIGCGEDKTPGVYADVAQFRFWIDEQLLYNNLDVKSYEY